jgi:uncharacterized protein
MPLSMYQTSVSVFTRSLTALDVILDKAVAHADGKKIAHDALLTARLFPDMFTFTKQVQLTTDFAKGPTSRLASVEIPKYADDEKTFPELKARIAKTIAYLDSFKPEQFSGSDDKDITFPAGPEKTLTLSGSRYLLGVAHPNFYFHFATAYDILRHNGVELGKRDFIGMP